MFWPRMFSEKPSKKFEVIARCAKFVNSSMIVSMIEFLQSFVPTATIFKLDIQMFAVEPEHRDSRQEFCRFSSFMLSLLRTHRFCPAFTYAVTDTQSAVVLKRMTASVKSAFTSTDNSALLESRH